MRDSTVYVAMEGHDDIVEATVPECLECDLEGEFVAALPHIERGEVCMIGGGAGPLGVVWMDTTGDGNDITDPQRAFAIARGEVAR